MIKIFCFNWILQLPICKVPLSLLNSRLGWKEGPGTISDAWVENKKGTMTLSITTPSIQQNVTQHKVLVCDTHHKRHSARMTLCITTLCTDCCISLNVMLKVFVLSIIMLNVITPSVVMLSVMAPYKKVLQTFLTSCKEILNLHDLLGLCNNTNRDQYY